MKNNQICIVSMLVCCLFMYSCKTDEQNAKNVAYAYSYALANYQVDEAEAYATEETKSTTLIKARQLVAAVGEAYIKSDTPAELEITDITFPNDTSAIATYHKKTPIKDFSGTVELRKRDGKWLAHDLIPIVSVPDPSSYQAPKQTSEDGKEIHEFQPVNNVDKKAKKN